MKFAQIMAAFVAGASVIGVAVSQTQSNQQSSHQTSTQQSGSGHSSASASSSSSSQGGQSSSGRSGGSSMQLTVPKPTHFIVFTPTPGVKASAFDQIRRARTDYFAKLQQMGKLVYFGPWRDVDRQDPEGELSVLIATDAEAKQIAANDPAVSNGLETAAVRAWTVQIDPNTSVAGFRTNGK